MLKISDALYSILRTGLIRVKVTEIGNTLEENLINFDRNINFMMLAIIPKDSNFSIIVFILNHNV